MAASWRPCGLTLAMALGGCAINHSAIHTGLEPSELNAAVRTRFEYGQSMQEVADALGSLRLACNRERTTLGSGEGTVEDRVTATVRPQGLYCKISIGALPYGRLAFAFEEDTLNHVTYRGPENLTRDAREIALVSPP